ncbi:hypothetical protein G7Y79_00009g027170 [Physcia stellaris]|nr:hypothetical protein G7Y79_00009g027170 [Physcia stellaris]
MANATDSLTSLLTSILDIFRSIIETLFHTIQTVFATAQNLISSTVDLAGGVVQFVLSNVVIIGVLIAAYVGYTAYKQKNQPGSISKKRA